MPSGHLRKRSDSSWTVVLELGYDPKTGKRIRRERAVRGTKRDAQEALHRMLREAEGGAYTDAPSSRMTVADLAEAWLAHIRTHRSPATADFYRWGIGKILPALGSTRLERLSVPHIQAALDNLLDSGQLRAAGAKKVLVSLHACLEFGRRMGWLGQNPAERVELSRAEERSPQVLSETDLERLLAAATGTQWEVPIWLAAHLGLRVGEIVALRWEDVDLPQRRLLVQRSMQRSGLTGPTKSRRPRVVELSSEDTSYLARWQERQESLRRAAPRWHHPELVVTGPYGEPIHVTSPTQAVRKLARRLGLPPLSMHDLRHTHGSLLLAKGWDLAAVSERLGHTSVAFTAKVYVHVLPGRQRILADQHPF